MDSGWSGKIHICILLAGTISDYLPAHPSLLSSLSASLALSLSLSLSLALSLLLSVCLSLPPPLFLSGEQVQHHRSALCACQVQARCG